MYLILNDHNKVIMMFSLALMQKLVLLVLSVCGGGGIV